MPNFSVVIAALTRSIFSRGVGDLEKLEQVSAGYATRERFLTELTLDPPEASGAEAGAPLLDEDYIILSTIHSAKGQEWDVVFILNNIATATLTCLRLQKKPRRSRPRSLVEGVDRGYAFAACGSLGRLGRLQALQAAPLQVSRLTP